MHELRGGLLPAGYRLVKLPRLCGGHSTHVNGSNIVVELQRLRPWNILLFWRRAVLELCGGHLPVEHGGVELHDVRLRHVHGPGGVRLHKLCCRHLSAHLGLVKLSELHQGFLFGGGGE